MKRDVAEILRDAMELPPAARAALAGSLLDSLDEAVDEHAELEWEVEISVRLDALNRGTIKLVPWAEARRRIVGRP